MNLDQKITRAVQYKEILEDAQKALRQSILSAEAEIYEMRSDQRAAKVKLSQRQAAQMLGVTRKTVARWLDNGKLKSTSVADVIACRWKKNVTIKKPTKS